MAVMSRLVDLPRVTVVRNLTLNIENGDRLSLSSKVSTHPVRWWLLSYRAAVCESRRGMVKRYNAG